MKVLVLILAAMFSALGSLVAEAADIYFVPLGVDTYVPITQGNIDENYFRYCHCNESGKDYKLLISALLERRRPSNRFLASAVRARIELPTGGTAYLDVRGNVMVGKHRYRLREDQLTAVQRLLMVLTHGRE